MLVQSFHVASDLWLVRLGLSPSAKTPAQPPPTNHILVIDCSGSMSSDLPKIRAQLKSKVPSLMAEGDTLSIVWFSGRGECGTLLEAEPVATLKDLQRVHNLIDRWLKPVGLTGFKEPLDEVRNLVVRIIKNKPSAKQGAAFSLFFMSDGCDNQWTKQEVLDAVTKAGAAVTTATFVEYGYYADRALLAQMAERAGGDLIFAEDFPRYEANLESSLRLKRVDVPRVNVKVKGDVIGGFVFSMVHTAEVQKLVTYGATNGVAQVAADVDEVWYLSPTAPSLPPATPGANVESALYACMSLFATRCRPDVVYPVLKKTGDVRFIDMFQNCFGKQKYTEFQELTRTAAFGPKERMQRGYDPSRVPPDDAFCLLDLLRLLESDEENTLLLDHPDFAYNRIGRGRLDASSNLTVEEAAQLEKLTEELKNERNAKKIAALTAAINAFVKAKEESALTFEPTPNPTGYPILNLTWNEDRPNISVLVKKMGIVDLSRILPKEHKTPKTMNHPKTMGAPVPEAFPTFVFRNYAIVKDGLVNVEKLPARVTLATYKVLQEKNVLPKGHAPPASDSRVTVTLDLRPLPVLNRKMVGGWKGGAGISAAELFKTAFELTRARAEQKVWNGLIKEAGLERESKGFAFVYGEEAAAWLKDHGFSDYGGFAPKVTLAESTDFYMGKELKISIKGYSTLPSLKDAREKLAKGKPNGPTLLMVPAMDAYNAFVEGKKPSKEVLGTFLNEKAVEARTKARTLLFEVAKTTFAVIVGQVWFREFSSLDDGSMQISVDTSDKANVTDSRFVEVDCKVEMKDVEIKI